MKRAGLFALAIAAVLATAACAPAAGALRDLIDSSDGATLTFRAGPPSGVDFNPGAEPALGVVVVATGTDLVLIAAPAGAQCTATAEVIDCRLGDVTELTPLDLTGRGVLASATYRRPGSNTVRQTFAR